MKIKQLLIRARLGFINSILDLATWINWMGSEERHNPYRCPRCGSADIHMRAWIAPNRGSRFVEDIIDDGADGDWCQSCERTVRARSTDELLASADKCWRRSEFAKMERVTGYRQSDFDPEDGYQSFVNTCEEWWNEKTPNEKINIYFEKN